MRNRTILITGASKGIGRALSSMLTDAGHQVIGVAREEDASFPGELLSVDLADPRATITALADLVARRPIDSVVNNVGLVDNLANIRVPMSCAVEGKAWVHTEYCLLANVIVAGKSATFNDIPHFKDGIVPGDGVFTLWSYYAGPGRVQSMLLSPQPISASTAKEWGVVAEVVPDGQAIARSPAVG